MTENEAPPARRRSRAEPDPGADGPGQAPAGPLIGTDPVEQDAPAAAPVTTQRSGAGRSLLRFLRDVVLIVLAAVVISFLIKTFLIRSFYIPSQSMEPTLEINDRIIVNQLEPRFFPVERGDIVVFRDPGGWLTPAPEPEQPPVVAAIEWVLSFVGLTAPDSNDHLIKRVIGLPGDTVACCNEFGQMSVNGVPLDEPYLQLPEGVTKVSRDDFEVTVPEDALWVMGDNRYNSQDSRYQTDQPGDGFVPMENVVGRAILISWPVERWTWLDNHAFVFADVDDPEAAPEPAPTPALTPGPAGDG